MADTKDLKSFGVIHEGSTPSTPTILYKEIRVSRLWEISQPKEIVSKLEMSIMDIAEELGLHLLIYKSSNSYETIFRISKHSPRSSTG